MLLLTFQLYFCIQDFIEILRLRFAAWIINGLRTYDTFRNLNLIFLKLCMSKKHSTVIFKTTLIHGVNDLFFVQIFEKTMQFMSKTSYSPKWVSFFAKCITSQVMALPEILICHVKIIFLLLNRNFRGKVKEFKKLAFNPKLV